VQRHSDLVLVVSSPGGQVRAPAVASVQVNLNGGGAATIYSDNGVTPQANPIIADSSGEYSFYAADGLYDLVISVPGFTTETKTAAVLLFDSTATLLQDVPNTLAQRNGLNAQTLLVYNKFTSLSNYERLAFAWSADVVYVSQESAGTGVARNLTIGTAGASVLQFFTSNLNRILINASGHLLWTTDNTLDIGAVAATRPRTGYFGTSVVSPAYTVGSTPGASFSGAVNNLTVVNGIVTAAS